MPRGDPARCSSFECEKAAPRPTQGATPACRSMVPTEDYGVTVTTGAPAVLFTAVIPAGPVGVTVVVPAVR